MATIAIQNEDLVAGRHIGKETDLVVDHLVTAAVRARVLTAATEVLVVKTVQNVRKVRTSG